MFLARSWPVLSVLAAAVVSGPAEAGSSSALPFSMPLGVDDAGTKRPIVADPVMAEIYKAAIKLLKKKIPNNEYE